MFEFGCRRTPTKRFRISLDKPRRSIVLLTAFLVKLDVSFRKKLLLFNSKYLTVFLYGLEAYSLSESDLSSIDFAFNGFFHEII